MSIPAPCYLGGMQEGCRQWDIQALDASALFCHCVSFMLHLR